MLDGVASFGEGSGSKGESRKGEAGISERIRARILFRMSREKGVLGLLRLSNSAKLRGGSI